MESRIFIHGLESSGQGTKGLFFKNRFPEMLTPDFTGDLAERMIRLDRILEGRSGIKIVGSSFGGLMASLYAMKHESRVNRLILLAPALNLIGFSGIETKKIDTPVWVFHGEKDEVIPLETVEKTAQSLFNNLVFNRVKDNHVLKDTFKDMDWNELLE